MSVRKMLVSQITTNGNQVDGVKIGELWCTYQLTCYRQQLSSATGRALFFMTSSSVDEPIGSVSFSPDSYISGVNVYNSANDLDAVITSVGSGPGRNVQIQMPQVSGKYLIMITACSPQSTLSSISGNVIKFEGAGSAFTGINMFPLAPDGSTVLSNTYYSDGDRGTSDPSFTDYTMCHLTAVKYVASDAVTTDNVLSYFTSSGTIGPTNASWYWNCTIITLSDSINGALDFKRSTPLAKTLGLLLDREETSRKEMAALRKMVLGLKSQISGTVTPFVSEAEEKSSSSSSSSSDTGFVLPADLTKSQMSTFRTVLSKMSG